MWTCGGGVCSCLLQRFRLWIIKRNPASASAKRVGVRAHSTGWGGGGVCPGSRLPNKALAWSRDLKSETFRNGKWKPQVCIRACARLICHRKPTVLFHLIQWVGLNLWPAEAKILYKAKQEEAGPDVPAIPTLLLLSHPRKARCCFLSLSWMTPKYEKGDRYAGSLD